MNDENANEPSEYRIEEVSEGGLHALIEDYGVRIQPPPPEDGRMLVGEVVDTHHPHRPGRVLVRWTDADQSTHEHWLARTAQGPLGPGTRVLLCRPANWPEWVVTSAFVDTSAAPSSPDCVEDASATTRVRVEAGETVRVETASGQLLFELLHRDRGAVLRLHRDLNLELPGTFSVRADRIEMTSGQGGTDSRSDGEMILRSPRIRLN